MTQTTIQSMTGYGQGDCEVSGARLHVEIRSVNHRFLEMTIRMPAGWGVMEEEVKSVLRRHLRRGKVNLTLSIEGTPASRREIDVDWELADGLVQVARSLKERYGLSGDITLSQLLQHPDLLQLEEANIQPEAYREPLLETVETAARSLVGMRRKEGESLARDLLTRLQTLERLAEEIGVRAPQVVNQYRKRLGERLRDFLDTASLDEDRILAEAALFADKADIAEELTRLRSHVVQFREALQRNEAVGRRLDFLIQEMNREVNTIGAKANDASIGSRVVECKSELEKMREQVQNIE
ncbi:YicC/YloC family endoribonuclease [Desmospora profundinema]|uniref:Uncharacterized protein (TIGR00255 family) n=1 Tax=Desmospora profundinema TaxID=1571184 RepID=A0ABU1IR18_9BACL|nr:YicC/YloC family endoribonuclease [Desmospora profundinema]MDR6227224.1 uncharacterized protein (TIGR00255 family) [Desmospora profundinema]